MRLLLEPQIYINQKFGGISRYYTEIFSRISKQNSVEVEVPLYYSQNVFFNESLLRTNEQKRIYFWINILQRLKISVRKKIRKQNLKLISECLLKNNYDLVIPTYYDTYFLENVHSKPFVLTVYDMIHELYPQYFKGQENVSINKKTLLEKASKVIAVSENTKKDILKIYPHINASKIEVIYHGNSLHVDKNVTVNLPQSYILFVGMREHYKNFNFFLKAVHNLLITNENLYVVCAGGGNFSEDETQFINSLGLKRKVIQYNFKDNELGMIYNKARCFVFPSEYEGFGIPVLEAMACGCPVVLTNASSFPEVAQDAGIFFESNNSNDLQKKINLVLTNNEIAQKYREKGLQQVKKFDWDKAAKQCLELYKNAIKDHEHK